MRGAREKRDVAGGAGRASSVWKARGTRWFLTPRGSLNLERSASFRSPDRSISNDPGPLAAFIPERPRWGRRRVNAARAYRKEKENDDVLLSLPLRPHGLGGEKRARRSGGGRTGGPSSRSQNLTTHRRTGKGRGTGPALPAPRLHLALPVPQLRLRPLYGWRPGMAARLTGRAVVPPLAPPREQRARLGENANPLVRPRFVGAASCIRYEPRFTRFPTKSPSPPPPPRSPSVCSPHCCGKRRQERDDRNECHRPSLP